MAAGFFVKNNSGTVQIDELYKNLVLKEVQSFSLTGGLFDVVATGEMPIPVFYSPYHYVALISVSVSGNTWTYRAAVNSASGTLKAYIFDVASVVTPSDNFGLRVWDASASLIYDTSQLPLRIVGNQNYPHTATGQFIYPGVNRVGVCISLLAARLVPVMENRSNIMGYGLNTINGMVQHGIPVGVGAINRAEVGARYGQFLAVDLSNYPES